MAQSEIDAVRALLRSKPRPVGWPARRKRLDEVGTVWPVADDVEFTAVDVNGIAGRIFRGSRQRSFSRPDVFSRRRLLFRFNRESSSLGYRSGPGGENADTCCRLSARAGASVSRSIR